MKPQKPKSPFKIFKEAVDHFQSSCLSADQNGSRTWDLFSLGAARNGLFVALKDILRPDFLPELEKDFPDLLELRASILEKEAQKLQSQSDLLKMRATEIRSSLPPKELKFRPEIHGKIGEEAIPSSAAPNPKTE